MTNHLEPFVDRVPRLFPPAQQPLRDPHPTQNPFPSSSLHILDLFKDIVRVLVLLSRSGREVGPRDQELREERVGRDRGGRGGGEQGGRERGEVQRDVEMGQESEAIVSGGRGERPIQRKTAGVGRTDHS